ncbi:hypothetical protein M3Y99_00997000 [Aphelenchoides fujianensis]|nr:hypothetical protein M3Y99_00997000 [Aphelenchoides fujianensis]
MDDLQTSAVLWIAQPEISQSRLGGRPTPSNACTLICICTAENLFRQAALFPDFSALRVPPDAFGLRPLSGEGGLQTECPPAVLNALLHGILDGNRLYERVRPANGLTFTVPEALSATGAHFREIQFCAVGRAEARRELPNYLRTAIQSPLLAAHKQLFFLLLKYERSILLVVQRSNGTIAAIDSHRHDQHGAYLLAGRLEQLEEFVNAALAFCFPESLFLAAKEQQFELSLIQFVGSLTPADCPLDSPPPPAVRLRGDERVFPPVPRHLQPARGSAEWLWAMKRLLHARTPAGRWLARCRPSSH